MLSRLWSPVAILLIATSSASAVDVFNPANGHYYRYLRYPYSWEQAQIPAFTQTHGRLRGHLVTITSESEQVFVEQIADATIWLGAFQPNDSPEPDADWQWMTGEPFSYSNWAAYEPNDYYGEDLIEMWRDRAGPGSGHWNDISPTQYAGTPSINRYALVIEFTPGYAPRLDGTDFLHWQRELGRSQVNVHPFLLHRSDFDGDGRVTGADLEVWRNPILVPEPAAPALLLFAAGWFLRQRRNQARRRAAIIC